MNWKLRATKTQHIWGRIESNSISEKATGFYFQTNLKGGLLYGSFWKWSWIVASAIVEIREVTSLPTKKSINLGTLIGKLDCLALEPSLIYLLITGLAFQKKSFINKALKDRVTLASHPEMWKLHAPRYGCSRHSFELIFEICTGRDSWRRFIEILCVVLISQTPFYQMTKTQKFGWIAVQSDVEILLSNRVFKLVHLYTEQSLRYLK